MVLDTASGEQLGVGQDGELCFRGPNVMKVSSLLLLRPISSCVGVLEPT